jgi:hypothetical protein
MYELIRRIDFSKIGDNVEKKELMKLYIEWLNRNYPKINTENTYFTDAIFIANNPSFWLDLMDILTDDDEGRMRYHSALIKHFESKGYDSTTAHGKAKDYVYKLDLLKEFLDEFENK